MSIRPPAPSPSGTIESAPDGVATMAASVTENEDTAFRVCEWRGDIYVAMGWSQGGGNLGGKVYTMNPTSGALTLAFDTGEASVRSLCVYRDTLYVGTGVGGKIYSYDGETATLAHTGTGGSSALAMVVYRDKLYVGETATAKVFSYDGTTWATAHDLADTHIESLAVFNDLLWIGTGNSAAAYNVYVSDGTNVGVVYTASTADKSEALAISDWRGKLYVSEYDPTGAPKLIEYDPVANTWTAITVPNSPTALYSLTPYRDALYIGSHPNARLFRYDGAAVVSVVQPTGMQSLRDLVVLNDRIFIGGRASGTPTAGAGVFTYGDASFDPARSNDVPQRVRLPRPQNERVVGTFDPVLITAALAIPANRAYYNRVRVRSPKFVSALRTSIGTSSGNICVGIYAADGAVIADTDVKAPLTRLATSGSVACPASGTRKIDLTAGVWLLPGDYWFAAAADNGTATLNALNPTIILSDLSQYQDTAFPLPATATGTAGVSGRQYPLWV